MQRPRLPLVCVCMCVCSFVSQRTLKSSEQRQTPSSPIKHWLVLSERNGIWRLLLCFTLDWQRLNQSTVTDRRNSVKWKSEGKTCRGVIWGDIKNSLPLLLSPISLFSPQFRDAMWMGERSVGQVSHSVQYQRGRLGHSGVSAYWPD